MTMGWCCPTGCRHSRWASGGCTWGCGGTAVSPRLGPWPAWTFVDRHPDLITSKGTIKMGLQDVGRISDDDWRGLVRAALYD